MVVCTLCTNKISRVTVCKKCGRAFCEIHQAPKCEFCGSTFYQGKIYTEKLFGIVPVEWLSIEGVKRVGLVDFVHVPEVISKILTFIGNKFEDHPYELILFPSKRSSNKFVRLLSKKLDTWPKLKGWSPPETSRYSVFANLNTGDTVLLLNNKAISEASIEFMFTFFSAFFKALQLVMIDRLGEVSGILFEAFRVYNKKMGIPFVSFEYDFETYITIFTFNIHFSYEEHRAFSKIVSDDNINEAAKFLGEKIDHLLDDFEWNFIDHLEQVFILFGKYVLVLSSVAATSSVPTLNRFMQQKLLKFNQKCKERLGNRLDIWHAMNILANNLQDMKIYSSRTNYTRAIRKAFIAASDSLEPKHVRLHEAAALFKMAQEYKRQLELGIKPVAPKLGTVEDFIELLMDVFRRGTQIYPEVSIFAGLAALEVLSGLMLLERKFQTYNLALEIGRKVSTLIETALPEIMAKNGPHKGGPGSEIRLVDAGLVLSTLSAFARMYGDEEESEKLLFESKNLAEKYNLSPLKMQLCWEGFLSTHEYENLSELRRLFLSFDPKEFKGLEVNLKFLGFLSAAILEKKRRKQNLQEAEKYALQMTEAGVFGPTVARLGMYCLRLFSHVLEAEESRMLDTVRKARVVAKALEIELSEIHPARSFIYKTFALCALLEKNQRGLYTALKDLERFSKSSPKVAQFIKTIRTWTETDPQDRMLRFVQTLDASIDQNDPWSRLALWFMRQEVKKDLKERDIIPYDAVLFVEGEDDEKIYTQFAKILRPDSNFLIINTEGWTNINYFANAKIAIEVKRPVVVIFDGDTARPRTEAVKKRLVGGLQIDPKNVITLKENSIENYLLVPEAIKRAFQDMEMPETEIAEFFKAKCRKKNKKGVLDLLFRRCNLGKYDGDKGAKIVSSMKTEEVHPEIRKIFELISSSRQ